MVEIVQDSVAPFRESVVPAIKFSVREPVSSSNIIILKFDGHVTTEDNKFVSNLVQLSMTPPTMNFGVKTLSERDQSWQSTYSAEMMFVLDKKAIDYIEDLRLKNKKHDVVLRFNLRVMSLIYNIKSGEYSKMQVQGAAQAIMSSPGRPDWNDANLRMLVTEMNNQLFSYQFPNSTAVTYTIRSSDWVNDFQGPFGMGRFLVVEIPQPESETLVIAKLKEEQIEFKNRLDKASEVLQKMELELNKGDWGFVVADSRQLVELFRRDMKGFVREIIAQTTSMNEDKAGSLTEAIDKLYAYASDLHHLVDQQGNVKKDVYTGGKEDAFLVYMISTSFVNLLRRKFATYVNAP